MTKVIKSRTFWVFIIFCLAASLLLVFFNLSQFKKYQINKRNAQRQTDILNLGNGIKSYIAANNNLPTSSNPDTKSFLPELLFEGNTPSGGINVQTLENMQGYIDTNIKDPSGTPYLIGTYEDQIVIYTTNFETDKKTTQTYFQNIKIVSSADGKVTTQ